MPGILPKESRKAVDRLLNTGLSDYEISRQTGVGRATVQRWRRRGLPSGTSGVPRISADWRPLDKAAYAYLLGMYLGDGTVTDHGGSFGLHVYMDDRYPDVLRECEDAIEAVAGIRPSRYLRPESACIRLTSYGAIWPMAFPQWGPGKKHERRIEFCDWQERIVEKFPRPFIRGLIHSDGARCLNRFSVELKDGPKEYAYPRYFFTNYSADIRGIFCDACDRIGVRWSQSSWRNISISHRRSVALLDSFVGPKT